MDEMDDLDGTPSGLAEQVKQLGQRYGTRAVLWAAFNADRQRLLAFSGLEQRFGRLGALGKVLKIYEVMVGQDRALVADDIAVQRQFKTRELGRHLHISSSRAGAFRLAAKKARGT